MLPSTEDRDRDQVVYRHVKGTKDFRRYFNDHEKDERKQMLRDIKIFTVNQLWLWVIPKGNGYDGDTVVTCFSQRWHENDPSGQSLLADILRDQNRQPISEVQDVIALVTSKCVDVFDRLSGNDPTRASCQLFEIFESAVGKAVSSPLKEE